MNNMRIRKIVAASMGAALILGAYTPVSMAQEQEQEQQQVQITPTDLTQHGYTPYTEEVEDGSVDVANARAVYDMLWTNNEFANGVRGDQKTANNKVGSKSLIEFLSRDGNAGEMSIKANNGKVGRHFTSEDMTQRATMVDGSGNLLPSTPNNITALKLKQLAIAHQLAFDANDMRNEGTGIIITYDAIIMETHSNLDIDIIEAHPEFGSTLSFLYANPFNFKEGATETKPEKWGAWKYKGDEQPNRPGEYFKQAAWLTAIDFDPELSDLDPDEALSSLEAESDENMSGVELSNDAADLSEEMKAGRVEAFVERDSDGALVPGDDLNSMLVSIDSTLNGDEELNPDAKASLESFKDAAGKALEERISESSGNNDDDAQADNVSGESSETTTEESTQTTQETTQETETQTDQETTQETSEEQTTQAEPTQESQEPTTQPEETQESQEPTTQPEETQAPEEPSQETQAPQEPTPDAPEQTQETTENQMPENSRVGELISNDWTGTIDNSRMNSLAIGSHWQSATDSQWYLREIAVSDGENGEAGNIDNDNVTFSKRGDVAEIVMFLSARDSGDGKWIVGKTDNPAEASFVIVKINGGESLYTLSVNSLINGEDFAQLTRESIDDEGQNQE